MKKQKKFRSNFSNPLNLQKLTKTLSKHKKIFTLRSIANIALYSFLIILFGIALLFAWFSKDLPTPGKIKHRYVSQSSQIYARDSKTPLYSISGEFKRTVITKEQMPLYMRQATVALEDKDFYHHIGVDFRGLARAVFSNLANKRYGGSTITQQFVKNALLTNEKSLTRKIKELILALEIEIMYSKEEILTKYLNEIPYGSNAYGVEAAASIYYNKHAQDLTLDEAATLASLVQMPTYFYNHQDLLKDRRNITLLKMQEQGYITKKQKLATQALPIQFIPRRENIKAPHFVMYVKEVLVEKYGEKMVESGGLKVTTTLDMDKQALAEKAVSDSTAHLKKYGASNTGLVALDPKTGQIIAMVGSLDYFDTKNDGNYNVTTAKRQPGSSIKPIVYATLLQGKYNPGSILFDLQTDFGKYVPKNYDGRFRGPVTIRYALGNSLNIPAVKALGLVGIDKMLETADNMGITTLTDPSRYGLSLALGAGEVRPLDMATAYGVFANSGTLAKTTPILKVTDANGRVLEEWKPKENDRKVLDPQVAYEISDVLSDLNAKKPVFSFTMNNLSLKDRPVAAKTGTSNDYKDAWTVGYTPQLVTAVWVGNNSGKPMSPSGGSIGAAPIWHQFMESTLKGQPVEKFSRPAEIQELTVEKYSNKLRSSLSKEFITDIFAKWQVPTERDDVNVKLRVCKSNNLLAPKNMPASQVEEKVFSNIHSEFPDKPGWENPVKAWAKSNGMYIPSPTRYCKLEEVVKPIINITEPADNASVSGFFTIRADASYNAGTIDNVEFIIDGTNTIGTVHTSPYVLTYNANQLSTGAHELSARVNASGISAKSSITITVGADVTPPGDAIIDVTHSTTTNNSASIFWTNPSDADLVKVRVYFSTSNGNIGSLKGEYAATPGSYMPGAFAGLPNGQKCFTVQGVDSSNNQNQNKSPQQCF
ncbi:MAG: penicillin-binding protein [bacterium]|nr:penicillin-binding protein [bacterium]